MIVEMKKLTTLIFYRDYHEFLEKLRDLGVIHIFTKKNIHLDNEDLLIKMNLLKSYKETIKFVNRYPSDGIEAKIDHDGKALYENIQKYRNKLEKLESSIAILNKDRSSLLPWGDFSREIVDKLSKAGARIDFFICTSSKFKDVWKEKFNAMEIANIGGQIYFITVSYDNTIPEIDAEPFDMPDLTLADLDYKKDQLVKEKDLIIRYFKMANLSVASIEEAKNLAQQEFEFDSICQSSNYALDDKLIVLEAWLPVNTEDAVKVWLNDKDVYFTLEKPTIEDNVPIKLKNNRFAKLFEFIGELYSMPRYGEIDLTPFFAPFFVLFFGLCLGDAGYGLLIFLGATLYKFKANKKTKPIMSLLQFLGIGTVVMGTLVGTFFGINLIPKEAQMIALENQQSVTWIEFIRMNMLDSGKVFNFSLILGAIQVVFGMFIKVANQVKQYGWGAAISTIGWLVLVFGGGAVYFMKESGMEYKIAQFAVLSLSGLLILVLNNPKRNIFMNFGVGLWDVYNMMSGLLGDILSYIRLFALGISSSVLGLVFNDIAVNMSGDIPVVSQVLMAIILIFGHGVNIFMAGLGSFVHPMRLTFVEFYKNAGFSGGGKKYSPFKRVNS